MERRTASCHCGEVRIDCAGAPRKASMCRLAQPDQSVWTKDKHAWVALPEHLPAFDLNPPARRPT